MSLWPSTECKIFIIYPFLIYLWYLFHEVIYMMSFHSFGRSSNKDPGVGRGESLSMKEHTGEITSTLIHFVGFITVQHLFIHICNAPL